jgi:uncharacterized membrane protein
LSEKEKGGTPMNGRSTKTLVLTGMMTALVFIATIAIRIPVPFTQGYIHAGDTMIFVSAALLGPVPGMIAAGVGSALADLMGGYPQWIIPTLLIKGIMGYLMGIFVNLHAKRAKQRGTLILALFSALIIGFFFILSRHGNLNPQLFIDGLEEVANADQATAMIAGVQRQLIAVLIGIPALTFLASTILNRKTGIKISGSVMIGMMIAGTWMVTGYYIAAGWMYGSFILPIFSIPWNVIQFVLGAVLGMILLAALNRTNFKKYME